jgi:hypothetical protein
LQQLWLTVVWRNVVVSADSTDSFSLNIYHLLNTAIAEKTYLIWRKALPSFKGTSCVDNILKMKKETGKDGLGMLYC